ncbi:hypothetical protein FRUB_07176 [Fimbriiglobus ruber]|uniref:Uncharacterized protein n=1 Tax=Fimbriiglobus ruber TaxID=1908690 RepID=A0A225DKS0_9BACT|nr:hypothetical protein FRUB_07176 [Fimbriiglobus ruber]
MNPCGSGSCRGMTTVITNITTGDILIEWIAIDSWPRCENWD